MYATSEMLHTMAAVKVVHLVCIDTSNLKDSCPVSMPGPGVEEHRESASLSLAEEIVPGMQRRPTRSRRRLATK